MTEVILNWIQIEPFNAFVEEKTELVHDNGIYLFLFPATPGYQVYYIGSTRNYYGRLKDHFRFISYGKWWLPEDIKYFQDDIYSLYRITEEAQYLKYFKKPDGSKKIKETGAKILSLTRVAISEIPDLKGLELKNMESLFIHGFLKKWRLPKLGWIGDTQTEFPVENFHIQNNFRDSAIESELSHIIPGKIEFNIKVEE